MCPLTPQFKTMYLQYMANSSALRANQLGHETAQLDLEADVSSGSLNISSSSTEGPIGPCTAPQEQWPRFNPLLVATRALASLIQVILNRCWYLMMMFSCSAPVCLLTWPLISPTDSLPAFTCMHGSAQLEHTSVHPLLHRRSTKTDIWSVPNECPQTKCCAHVCGCLYANRSYRRLVRNSSCPSQTLAALSCRGRQAAAQPHVLLPCDRCVGGRRTCMLA